MRSKEDRAAERLKNLGKLVEAAENLLEKVTEYQMQVWRYRNQAPTSTAQAMAANYFQEAYGWSNKVHRYLDREKGLSL